MDWTPLDPRNPYYAAACERHMEKLSMDGYMSRDNCVKYDDCQAETIKGERLPPNPKQAYGDRKTKVALFPPAAVLYAASAMEDGAVKYGPYNWRDKAVEAMTYIHAAMRHIYAWQDGEDVAADSGAHHLGHAIACLGILADAIETGNLIDNRPSGGAASKTMDRLSEEKATRT